MNKRRLSLETMDTWWRVANYLSVGQIYLLDNPLLREPLQSHHIKPRLLGHWGTCPGINLPWAHMNRLIIERDISSIFICGPGHEVFQVSGNEPEAVHEALADALDTIADRHADIIEKARQGRQLLNVRWPMLVLRTPKGWTGSKQRDNQPVEGHFRSHQVPLGHDLGAARLCEQLEQWLQSYHPEQLFEPTGAPVAILDSLRPEGDCRMSANPRTNAGKLLKPLNLPTLDGHAIDSAYEGDVGQCENGNKAAAEKSDTVAATGGDGSNAVIQSAMSITGNWLRDFIKCNPDNFRLLGADEIDSNRLSAIFEATDRAWMLDSMDSDVHLSTTGRTIEVLSENLCQGLLEGYLLTGRHGIFTSYKAFIHVVDSMFNKHAKWLESAGRVSWREPLASLTYLLSSHVWRQDHNGFSHQDPGFLDVVANKRADVVRIYLPAS